MNLIRLYHTLKPLRWQQYWYRAWYPVKRKLFTIPEVPAIAIEAATSWLEIKLFLLPAFDLYNPVNQSFTLLNIKQSFPEKINWNTLQHGALWRYHLNYMGWLNDESLSVEERAETIRVYYADFTVKAGLDAYPISIRGMNLIRFMLQHAIKNRSFAEQTYKHYCLLYSFPEYHLQGNHLWQNGCSLICAGYYFKDKNFYRKGKKILDKSLEEQVLSDGAHIERAPMYHSLLLSSLLQCIELSIKLEITDDPAFRQKMQDKAAIMLGWSQQVAFNNGEWPQINDSTGGVAPNLRQLQEFSKMLNIQPIKKALNACGYRMYRKEKYDLFVNAGSIQPAWQPGHAHSDELTFCLNINRKPVIVDPGIHTYQEGPARNQERGTDAHNALSVNKKNASDVWKSFRVGKKAKVWIEKEDDKELCLTHNGFIINYTREFSLLEDFITLVDYIPEGKHEVTLNLHFSPDIVLKKYGFYEFLAGNLQIDFRGASSVEIETYNYCVQFNKQVQAQRLHIKATSRITTRLQILDAD
jgi:hypothetical protein